MLPPYERSARLYDAIHDAEGKDYAKEADAILQLLAGRHSPTATLLDVACGTGRHLEHFSQHLRCVGVDVHEGMLTVARERCPEVPFVRADMVTLDIGQHFDVVTCLFSAIGYAKTEERLHQAVASMARHLNPGGVLVVEPWFQSEQWFDGFLSMTSIDKPQMKAARVSLSRRKGEMALMDFHYVVGTPEGIDGFVEHHELALFGWDQYREAFDQCGLSTEIDKVGLTGRGLIIGHRAA